MKFNEIEKIAKDTRKAIGRKYGFRQKEYINWKIKDGYFFCLDTLHIVHTELSVKPLFIDNLYWNIIYPNREEKRPDSLRGDGLLSHLCVKIWEEWFPKNLKTEFTAEQYEQIMTDVFLNAEKKIDSFLQKYPHPSLFGLYLKDNNKRPPLSDVLILINEEKFEEASLLARTCIDNKPKILHSYRMEDGSSKNEYEFMLEYCLRELLKK